MRIGCGVWVLLQSDRIQPCFIDRPRRDRLARATGGDGEAEDEKRRAQGPCRPLCQIVLVAIHYCPSCRCATPTGSSMRSKPWSCKRACIWGLPKKLMKSPAPEMFLAVQTAATP